MTGLVMLAACTDSAPLAPTETVSLNVTSGAQYKSVSHAISTAAGRLGNLLVGFDESGVGNAAGTTIERVYYHVDALCACKNGGANWPADPKTQGVSFDGFFEQEFANHGGRARGTIEVPAPASTLNRPGGQISTRVAIRWVSRNAIQFRLHDATNDVTFPLANIGRVLDATYNRDTTPPQ